MQWYPQVTQHVFHLWCCMGGWCQSFEEGKKQQMQTMKNANTGLQENMRRFPTIQTVNSINSPQKSGHKYTTAVIVLHAEISCYVRTYVYRTGEKTVAVCNSWYQQLVFYHMKTDHATDSEHFPYSWTATSPVLLAEWRRASNILCVDSLKAAQLTKHYSQRNT